MAGTSTRRPLPAVVFILLLSLLTGLVWWRVLHRPDAGAGAPGTSTASCTPSTARGVAWPKPSTITLSVLNATNRNGLAHSVAKQLKGRGFKIGPIGNDATSGATTTQVRYGPKATTAARLVQFYLPGAKLVATPGNSRTVVVAVGSSYRRLASTKQVARAQTASGC